MLTCGCVPLPGGGVVKRCKDGQFLWGLYQLAFNANPGDQRAWGKTWAEYAAHIGQEAWV